MPAVARIRRPIIGWVRNPLFLLAIVGALAAIVVQSGELGTSDTQHRLQATHSFWTSEPPVFPDEYPEFGIHGRGGKLYGWYGLGQSLLMLPADVVGTYVQRLPIFRDYNGNDPSVRNIVVAYSTSTLVCVLAVLVCFRFLRLLDFSLKESVAGALALLFATTFLHYTQNLMENNLILLLTLSGLCFQFEWLRTGSRRAMLLGSAALGANIVVRLTTALDLAAVALFVLLVLWMDGCRGAALISKLRAYALAAAPWYAAGLLVDRLYEYIRFGSWWTNYMTLFGREQRSLDPTLPANFPWSTPWRDGLFGPLFSPEKSIFLFDPLLILTLFLAFFLWRRLAGAVKAYLLASLVLLAGYIFFYARFFDWSGDFAWGDRYVSTAAQMVAFISVPLLVRYRAALARPLYAAALALIAASVAIQIASVLFWCPLEIYQMDIIGRPAFVIGMRFKNAVTFLLGKMVAGRPMAPSAIEDPWDYAHITTFNFLPFVLRRVGEAPSWAVDVIFGVWVAALAALMAAFAALFKLIRVEGRAAL